MDGEVPLPPEVLPCPSCGQRTAVQPVSAPLEIVHCQSCGRLLRRRPPLSAEQRAQAMALRWAAGELEAHEAVAVLQRRRKLRGDSDEAYARGMLAAAEQLRQWARIVHCLPRLTEGRPTQGGR